jgi:hypothetical protein
MTDLRLFDGRREAWVIVCGVGGWVCAEPDLTSFDGLCNMPVESEPCGIHHPEAIAAMYAEATR